MQSGRLYSDAINPMSAISCRSQAPLVSHMSIMSRLSEVVEARMITFNRDLESVNICIGILCFRSCSMSYFSK